MNANRPDARPLRALLLIVVCLTSAAGWARLDFIRVVDLKNGEFLLSRYPLTEERWDHPRLQLLRKREKLDEVIASGKTQFEKIVLLRGWTRRQWESAPKFYYPPWDAVEILDLARKRRNYGFCAQYSIVFVQACLSLGLHARYVDAGHFLAAVWSDDFNRWVIMDPTNDDHYERRGLPLKGTDLSDAVWSGDLNGIERVSSDGVRTPALMGELEIFRHYSILLRNDQLSAPGLVSINGKLSKLVSQGDYRRYPLVGKDMMGYGDSFLAWRSPGAEAAWPGRRESDDPDDFRDRSNQTVIFVARTDAERGIVKLKFLAEQAEGFQSFLGKGDGRDYEEVPGDLIMRLRPGMNEFKVRVKTRFGWVGPESSVKLYYKPRWSAKT